MFFCWIMFAYAVVFWYHFHFSCSFRPSVFCLYNRCFNWCHQRCCWTTSSRFLLALFPWWKRGGTSKIFDSSIFWSFLGIIFHSFSSWSYLLIHTVTCKWSMPRCLILSQRMLCVLDWRKSLRRDTKASQAGILHVSSLIILWNCSQGLIKNFCVRSNPISLGHALFSQIRYVIYTLLYGGGVCYLCIRFCSSADFFMCCPYIFSSAYVWIFLACSFALFLLFSVSPEH